MTAVETTELLSIGKEDMRNAIEANKDLSEHISTVLAFRQYQLMRMMTFYTNNPSSPGAAPAKKQEPKKEEAKKEEPRKEEVKAIQKDLGKRISTYFSK